MESWLIYAAAGAVAGFTSGLFGIGGGLVIVSVLLFVFQLQDVPEAVRVHMAIGTSLATIVITALSSIRAHYRLGGIIWPVFRRLSVGIVVGVALGAVLADALPGEQLGGIFAIFVLLMALQMGLGGRPKPHRSLPGTPGLVAGGGVVGAVSALLGIGGGSLTVPFLAWCGMEMRKAVGTSAACGLPIAVVGAISYVITGWNEPLLPTGATGYVYWPAVVGIVLVSALVAPVGAKLAHRLPGLALKRAFAVLLAIIGVRLLLG